MSMAYESTNHQPLIADSRTPRILFYKIFEQMAKNDSHSFFLISYADSSSEG